MLWESTSERVNELISYGGEKNNKAALQMLLSDAKKWKPEGYNAAVSKRRDYYNDNTHSHVKAEMKRRYPKTGDELPVYTQPLFKRLCELGASMYQSPSKRELVNTDKEHQDDETQIMTDIYDEGSVDHMLGHGEEISVAASPCFGRCGWEDNHLDIKVYWGDQVDVILDPDSPTELKRARCVIAERASDSGVNVTGDQKRYEVWIQDGSQWTWYDVTADGKRWEIKYTGYVLPWFAIHYKKPLGSLFELPAADDITVNEAHNVTISDLLHTISMQSFGTPTYTGDPDGIPADTIIGPGHILMGGADGQWGSINYNPSIDPVLSTVKQLTAMHLNLRSADPGAASADPSYESGVALKVKQLPAARKRSRRLRVYEKLEQRDLWPIIADVNRHPERSKLIGLAMKWSPGQEELPVDDEAQMRLSQTRVAMHISTWPEEMVTLRLASDLADAKRKFEENAEFNAQYPPMAHGVPFMMSENKAKLMEMQSSQEEPQSAEPRDEAPPEPEE